MGVSDYKLNLIEEIYKKHGMLLDDRVKNRISKDSHLVDLIIQSVSEGKDEFELVDLGKLLAAIISTIVTCCNVSSVDTAKMMDAIKESVMISLNKFCEMQKNGFDEDCKEFTRKTSN